MTGKNPETLKEHPGPIELLKKGKTASLHWWGKVEKHNIRVPGERRIKKNGQKCGGERQRGHCKAKLGKRESITKQEDGKTKNVGGLRGKGISTAPRQVASSAKQKLPDAGG